MAHTHDQTLLTRLGFQDPDRKTPEHDLACRYLTQREQLQKIAALYYPFTIRWFARGGEPRETVFSKCVSGNAALEVPLTKGANQYKTHIGFFDVVINFLFVSDVKNDDYDREQQKVVIEVKIQPLDIGTILRQLNLYKEHSDCKHWLLATAFPLNVEEVKSFGDIKHVYLNPAYKEYAKQPVAESMVV